MFWCKSSYVVVKCNVTPQWGLTACLSIAWLSFHTVYIIIHWVYISMYFFHVEINIIIYFIRSFAHLIDSLIHSLIHTRTRTRTHTRTHAPTPTRTRTRKRTRARAHRSNWVARKWRHCSKTAHPKFKNCPHFCYDSVPFMSMIAQWIILTDLTFTEVWQGFSNATFVIRVG